MNSRKVKSQNENSPIEILLRGIALKRARALRWNMPTMLGFYTLLGIIALLQLEGVNISLVMGIATLGLFGLWIVSRARWKKLEQKLYQEEMDNYRKIVSQEHGNSIAIKSDECSNSTLSKREVEVLVHIARGKTNKDIATNLGISPQTVKNHITHILEKMGADDRNSAVIMALAQGLIKIDGHGTTTRSTWS